MAHKVANREKQYFGETAQKQRKIINFQGTKPMKMSVNFDSNLQPTSIIII